MLLRLGIASTIYRERRPAGESSSCRTAKAVARTMRPRHSTNWSIAGDNLLHFAELVGFADRDKRARLDMAIASYRRRRNRERFVAQGRGDRCRMASRRSTTSAFPASTRSMPTASTCTIAASSRCRPTAPACSGSINLARLVDKPFAPDAGLDAAAPGGADAHRRALPRQRHRRLELSAAGAAEGGQGQAAHRPRRHRARRRADPVRRALRHARGAWRWPRAGWRPSSARPTWPAPSWRARRAPSRSTTRERFLAARRRAALARGGARRHRAATASATALLTSIAPTGTISLLAGNVSSGIEPVFDFHYERRVLERDGTRAHRDGRGLRARPLSRAVRRQAPLTPAFVDAPSSSTPARAPGDAGRRCSAMSTARSPRPSTARPTSPSRPSRTSIWRPTTWACKGCTTYRPERRDRARC